MKIKVFSDYSCPFCYIAMCFFENLRKDGIKFDIEWIPYEIHPDIPEEGKTIESKYPKGYAEKMHEVLTKFGKEYGIEYKDYNTHKALLAGEFAKTVGIYDEFSKKIFKAYFTEQLNIGDEKILNTIAKEIGLDVKEMNKLIDSGVFDEKIEKAKKLIDQFKIEGTPTFIINDKHKIVGIRHYEQMKRAILAYSESKLM
ncbi:DsbA family oxidoreductase [Tepidimicrobium xylanilyticum]|uniref:Predicted dithiol-disulfide isomerase, DsbA family n=1 Tax=Tepidimicrobium xylanilyticum TaxID=1123352 RepID=A0A1H2SX43_9FIRM|nr:DsbA family protein [Tepidimicrobium xylanilyticum]GMG96103.1 DSBA oxidoreductase [Tepidimicrobium xylanilyticum]SDW35609.1 Predicted dithiol-disulfide isomerase, DsbA family [Tepidimicrobium xylanilyticum]